MAADVRQYTVRKRPAQGAGPPRPPKRPQAAPPSEPTGSGVEPIIAMSALMVLVEVPFEGPSAEGAASPEGRVTEESIEDVPAVQPAEEVREEEAHEPERPASAAAASSGDTRSGSSMPSFSDIKAWLSARGKAPMALDDEGSIVPPESEAPVAEETADPSPGGPTTRAEAEADAEQATEDQAAPTPEAQVDSPTVPTLRLMEEVDSED
uniref:Sarcalumenin-like n=1 Tax=Elaeis guineensis var. tenera TaxID=51953 RepID=A0A6I9QQT0_ELAGV|nr:sarcalumenin-like [Elaeis guineensis]